jgi:peptide-methionine (R)-S-oxide reductase
MEDETAPDPLALKEDEWQRRLAPEQFEFLRRKATERAFSGEHYDNHQDGLYRCAGCGEVLFDSASKYDSGSGWPSFDRPAGEDRREEHRDTSHGMLEIEVTCNRCGGHLGHVFPDGPPTTGLRYCINSASLKFEPKVGD